MSVDLSRQPERPKPPEMPPGPQPPEMPPRPQPPEVPPRPEGRKGIDPAPAQGIGEVRGGLGTIALGAAALKQTFGGKQHAPPPPSPLAKE